MTVPVFSTPSLCAVRRALVALLLPFFAAAVHADNAPAMHAVTATPPLQVAPATPVSKNVQQRMRSCNGSADGRKLAGAARESFIKSCMAPRHARTPSHTGSQPKPNP